MIAYETLTCPQDGKNEIYLKRRIRRVLLLSGARQFGKTTLAQELIDDDTEYRTLDNVTLKKATPLLASSFTQENTLHRLETICWQYPSVHYGPRETILSSAEELFDVLAL